MSSRKNMGFVLLLVICLLIGCTKKGEKAIVFAVGGAPNEIDFWEDLITSFEKKEGIKVNILRQPTDTDQRRQGLLIPLKSKQPDPDAFLMDVVWIAQFAASGWLEPLDRYFKDSNMHDHLYFEKVIRLADRYQGNPLLLHHQSRNVPRIGFAFRFHVELASILLSLLFFVFHPNQLPI